MGGYRVGLGAVMPSQWPRLEVCLNGVLAAVTNCNMHRAFPERVSQSCLYASAYSLQPHADSGLCRWHTGVPSHVSADPTPKQRPCTVSCMVLDLFVVRIHRSLCA
jgi:hypothetical protein